MTLSSTRVAFVAVVVLAVLAVVGLIVMPRRETAPTATQLRVSGRIEGIEADVVAKAGGRIGNLLVRDGASVKRGQLLLVIDDKARSAALVVADTRLSDALKSAALAHKELASLASPSASPGPRGAAAVAAVAPPSAPRINPALSSAHIEYELARIRLLRAREDFRLAQTDRDRISELVKTGDVSQANFDRSQTAFEAATEALHASESGLHTAEADVAAASTTLPPAAAPLDLDAQLVAAQSAARELHVAQARLNADRADAQVAAAKARRDEALAAVADLSITAPSDGILVMRGAQASAVVTPGQTLLGVFDPGSLYLHAFVAEADIARLRVGQSAELFLASAPERALRGHVSEVDFAASLQSDDRTHPTFGLRVALDDASDAAKPGEPANGVVDLTAP